MTLRVHTVLYDGVEDQDFIGPVTALGVVGEVQHSFVTVDGPGTVTTAAGLEITIRTPWSPGRADLIVVPGGGYGEGSPVQEQIRRGAVPGALIAARRPGLILAATCTGTLLLSAAGITTGRRCTTHHIAEHDLRQQGAVVVGGRVVDDGDLVTSAGVTSGIDLGLWLVERLFGAETAALAEEVLEHERRGDAWTANRSSDRGRTIRDTPVAAVPPVDDGDEPRTTEGVTFVNAIELPAELIDEFVHQWRARAARMRTAPGFRDVRLHRAILPDARFQLVDIAHWDSAEACEAAGLNPTVVASADEARTIATAHPALYRVAAEYF
ncbi:DJ-1/PfpI family protein [Nocardia rhamnosiphila]|uniref:DJ-1/PfpI family protein n=1 Tax=Nocardia rhamnosiphila TaxID=426716 RepID=UPI000A78E034|nr:DJ-1/PfpI family protein [Nocardia rhamnosiphila]